MDIKKVNEAVKLACQIEAMKRKLGKLKHELTSPEYIEFNKRMEG